LDFEQVSENEKQRFIMFRKPYIFQASYKEHNKRQGVFGGKFARVAANFVTKINKNKFIALLQCLGIVKPLTDFM